MTTLAIPLRKTDLFPAGKLGLWLFLVSEGMFFLGLLASYVVLRSGDPALFHKMSGVLDARLGAVNTALLLTSSFTMAGAMGAAKRDGRARVVLLLLVTLLLGCGFLGIKSYEYADKARHQTAIVRDGTGKSATLAVIDGHATTEGDGTLVIHGYRAPLSGMAADAADLHALAPADVQHGSANSASVEEGEFRVPASQVVARASYLPSRNLFLACYFVLTGMHVAHLIGGLLPVLVLLVQAARGKILARPIEYVGLYWYFVDVVWLVLFPLLYFA